MRFKTHKDIEAPIDVVFARLTDFDQFERQALQRGASVKRLSQGPIGVGSEWDLSFQFRGKGRRLKAKIDSFDRPNEIHLETEASGIVGTTMLDLVQLSPKRTRFNVNIDLKPNTLSARLLLQSLKLARGTLMQRLKKRVEAFAEEVERG